MTIDKVQEAIYALDGLIEESQHQMSRDEYDRLGFIISDALEDLEELKKIKEQMNKPLFTTEELWDFEYHLAKIILPGLISFKDKSLGHPGNITQEEWEEILDKMIWSFNEKANGEPSRPKDIREAIDGFYYKKLQEGFELFGLWYQNLWY